MQAPSAANQQPWEFYVVTNKEKLKALSDVHPYSGMVKEAPVAIELPDRFRAFAVFPYGYPAEEKPQQDRFDESRIHYVE